MQGSRHSTPNHTRAQSPCAKSERRPHPLCKIIKWCAPLEDLVHPLHRIATVSGPLAPNQMVYDSVQPLRRIIKGCTPRTPNNKGVYTPCAKSLSGVQAPMMIHVFSKVFMKFWETFSKSYAIATTLWISLDLNPSLCTSLVPFYINSEVH